MNIFRIINWHYYNKNNLTVIKYEINNKTYELSFSSNPLLEVELLELHEKLIDVLLTKIALIIKEQEYDYKTNEILKTFYNNITNLSILESSV